MFFPVLNRKCVFLQQTVQWVTPDLAPTACYCITQQRCVMLFHIGPVSKKILQLLCGLQEATPLPQTSFFSVPKSSISNHFPIPSKEDPISLFIPPPCLKAWLIRIHAALCIAVNSKNIFAIRLSLHTQNSGSIWISVPSDRSDKCGSSLADPVTNGTSNPLPI